MYIPRPTKPLFPIDDGWNRLLMKYHFSVFVWEKQVVERILTCCTGAIGIVVIAAIHLTARTPNISVRAAKSKAPAPAA